MRLGLELRLERELGLRIEAGAGVHRRYAAPHRLVREQEGLRRPVDFSLLEHVRRHAKACL